MHSTALSCLHRFAIEVIACCYLRTFSFAGRLGQVVGKFELVRCTSFLGFAFVAGFDS